MVSGAEDLTTNITSLNEQISDLNDDLSDTQSKLSDIKWESLAKDQSIKNWTAKYQKLWDMYNQKMNEAKMTVDKLHQENASLVIVNEEV